MTTTELVADLQPVKLGSHFEINARGLHVTGQPTFNDCESLWETLLTAEKTIQFAIGDAMKYFRARWGERADQIISERTGWTFETLRNYEWVADKVPQEVRRLDRLLFSHHIQVAKLAKSPREQRKWLDKAAGDESEAKPWTVRQLRAAITAGVDQPVTTWICVALCTSETQRDDLVRELESRGIKCKSSERRGE